jgi:hypothetical protein
MLYIPKPVGFVSAHRYWCRINGYPVRDHSEDNESTAGETSLHMRANHTYIHQRLLSTDFDLLVQEHNQELDNMDSSTPPTHFAPGKTALKPPSARKLEVIAAVWHAETTAKNTTTIDPESMLGAWLQSYSDHFDRRNNLQLVATARAGSKESTLPHGLYKLLERLQQVSLEQDNKEPIRGGELPDTPDGTWPGMLATAEEWLAGPPVWDSPTTPPGSWEEYWSTKHRKKGDSDKAE